MALRAIECVPNISEGRRPEVIEAVAAAVRATPGVKLLDVQSDASHNRTVVTFAGGPNAVAAAALAVVREAVARIDLREHRGEHPRIGAADVVPFVPVGAATMEECVALARRVGQEVWTALRVPVYFYARAATAPHRVRLPDIRKGEFEGLAAKMRQPGWAPDIGEAAPHPTAGAVAIGARPPLIAYNINLHTTDLAVARAVARAIRESSGGLVGVQAMGVTATSGLAQVSINVLDHRRTPLARIFDLVRLEAERYGVAVAESEIVGLVPLDAVVDVAKAALRLHAFDAAQVLEARLVD
ncbi:MAG: glutamate formimidoyltransferase [Armatimonadota bacterium]|nr:glutamate formimidoyltransferase [Armatimonadota bacterium]MDR7421135.1 glutamate formimidoyltransferase [Armatimonadota bacterium]MDR7453450.1 glutamate formimidoyltransferase [Armatimonadota bacterium]MDR7457463.1 glutamate formimidoyltransferase [Armatimonadota bacterium]MDR7496119.1 glutamate formimidoyltransferase [Armatimonadota bacterium]